MQIVRYFKSNSRGAPVEDCSHEERIDAKEDERKPKEEETNHQQPAKDSRYSPGSKNKKFKVFCKSMRAPVLKEDLNKGGRKGKEVKTHHHHHECFKICVQLSPPFSISHPNPKIFQSPPLSYPNTHTITIRRCR